MDQGRKWSREGTGGTREGGKESVEESLTARMGSKGTRPADHAKGSLQTACPVLGESASTKSKRPRTRVAQGGRTGREARFRPTQWRSAERTSCAMGGHVNEVMRDAPVQVTLLTALRKDARPLLDAIDLSTALARLSLALEFGT